MKKIYRKLKILYYKLKFKIQKHFISVTPRGECMIKYLIDRYVNCTLAEPNEVYEESLRSYIQKYINVIPDTLVENVPEALREDLKKYHCIFAYLCSILLFSKDKQGWLDYITHEKIRKLIIETIGD